MYYLNFKNCPICNYKLLSIAEVSVDIMYITCSCGHFYNNIKIKTVKSLLLDNVLLKS